MCYVHQSPMGLQLIAVFLSFLSALAKDCTYHAPFIKREIEFFNRTNFDSVCYEEEKDYIGPLASCGRHIINPKCVCAYDMYILDINELCPEHPRKNGSLKHVDVNFCRKYSFNNHGPCQNGGTLKESSELAMDAKCNCPEGYSGDYCDSTNINIVCTVSRQESLKDIPDCTKKTLYKPSGSLCSLTLRDHWHFICDPKKPALEGTMDCNNTEYLNAVNTDKFNGNAASGKSCLSVVTWFCCLFVLLCSLS